jgi:peptide-methionine (R)-S-oxide reductase
MKPTLDRRAALAGSLCALAATLGIARRPARASASFPLVLSDAEWRKRLSPAAYAVLRRAATETPGSSPLDHEHRPGTYACAGCAHPLFDASTKFDSGTGWPSFYAPLPRAVGTSTDVSLFVPRTEVHCAQCGGHLGHVFDDGPKPTGLRYCMNGVALAFQPRT